jgi:hypothetical protein
MNIAFHNGDISTVLFDEDGGRHLLAALKALVPNAAKVLASSVTREGTGIVVQEGYMSG